MQQSGSRPSGRSGREVTPREATSTRRSGPPHGCPLERLTGRAVDRWPNSPEGRAELLRVQPARRANCPKPQRRDHTNRPTSPDDASAPRTPAAVRSSRPPPPPRSLPPALGAAPSAHAAEGPAFLHGVASGDPLPDGILLWTRVTPTADAVPGSGQGPEPVTVELGGRRGRGLQQGRRSRHAGRSRHRPHRQGGRTRTGRRHRLLVPLRRRWRGLPRRPDPHRPRRGRRRRQPALRRGLLRELRGRLLRLVPASGRPRATWTPSCTSATTSTSTAPASTPLQGTSSAPSSPSTRSSPSPTTAPGTPTTSSIPTCRRCTRRTRSSPSGTTTRSPTTPGPAAPRTTPPARRASGPTATGRQAGLLRVDAGAPLHRGHHLPAAALRTLADLHLLDLRSFRDQQASIGDGDVSTTPSAPSPDASSWTGSSPGFLSTARWRMVGTSVMIAPFAFGARPADLLGPLAELLGIPKEGLALNVDQWDGYTDDRRELLTHLRDQRIGNTVFLTGDIHMAFANDVPVKAATYPRRARWPRSSSSRPSPPTTSTTSSMPPRTPSRRSRRRVQATNRHVRWLDMDSPRLRRPGHRRRAGAHGLLRPVRQDEAGRDPSWAALVPHAQRRRRRSSGRQPRLRLLEGVLDAASGVRTGYRDSRKPSATRQVASAASSS